LIETIIFHYTPVIAKSVPNNSKGIYKKMLLVGYNKYLSHNDTLGCCRSV